MKTPKGRTHSNLTLQNSRTLSTCTNLESTLLTLILLTESTTKLDRGRISNTFIDCFQATLCWSLHAFSFEASRSPSLASPMMVMIMIKTLWRLIEANWPREKIYMSPEIYYYDFKLWLSVVEHLLLIWTSRLPYQSKTSIPIQARHVLQRAWSVYPISLSTSNFWNDEQQQSRSFEPYWAMRTIKFAFSFWTPFRSALFSLVPSMLGKIANISIS